MLYKFQLALVGSHLDETLLFSFFDGFSQRQNHLEPVPTFRHWKQEFEIDANKNLRIQNQTSSLDEDRNKNKILTENHIMKISNNTIELGGKTGLNIIAIKPLQKGTKAKEDVATISRVLADQLGTESISEILESFTGTNNPNLKKFRLKAEFHSLGSLVETATSDTIIDTGDRNVGAMEIQNVIPQKSGVAGGSEVCMISEFPLASDVIPVFRVVNSEGQSCPEWEGRINQPDETQLTRKQG